MQHQRPDPSVSILRVVRVLPTTNQSEKLSSRAYWASASTAANLNETSPFLSWAFVTSIRAWTALGIFNAQKLINGVGAMVQRRGSASQ